MTNLEAEFGSLSSGHGSASQVGLQGMAVENGMPASPTEREPDGRMGPGHRIPQSFGWVLEGLELLLSHVAQWNKVSSYREHL